MYVNTITQNTNPLRVALYMRYSSNKQTEQSIEGQRRECMAFANRSGLVIVKEYIDRATSAYKDTEKRTSFLTMIKDASQHMFDAVLVWKLDRFSRNEYDFARYSYALKQAGVKIISATEPLDDANPAMIITRKMLEGFAEYYSMDLSQKAKRGMYESATKKQVLGGPPPLGLMSVNKKYVPDPNTAPIVKMMFEDYASGMTLMEVAKKLSRLGIKTIKGNDFNQMAVQRVLRNEKYIGVYDSHGIRDENAIEPIVAKDLFNFVQAKLELNRRSMRRRGDRPPFLLQGKIYCGHCGHAMVPESGTSKGGAVHYYYKCHGRKTLHNCNKRIERKEEIEDAVIADAMQILTDENIEILAQMMEAELKREEGTSRLAALKKQRDQAEKEANNLVDILASGVSSETVLSRLREAEKKKEALCAEIDIEENTVSTFDIDCILAYLEHLRDEALDDPNARKTIVDALVDRVDVFDEDDGTGRLRIVYRLDPTGRNVPLSYRYRDHLRDYVNNTLFIHENGSLVLIRNITF